MNDANNESIKHLDQFGYCLLEDLIPREEALDLADRCVQMHGESDKKPDISGSGAYQTLFGMMNHDDRVWSYASHPKTVAIARHFLGPHCRVVEACSKPTWPGAVDQPLHADSAGAFLRVPDTPWMINSIWMLTDFTVENGATGVVPLSHRSRMASPPEYLTRDPKRVKPITGRAGSVMMWHGGTFHMARGNTSDTIRVGLNIAYYPPWFNNWIEGGHQPIWPETYARMPERMQQLCPGKLSNSRDEAYETRL
ncbi:MAG: hypothetical protein HOH43_17105 [Candidatus Latescibacteria bacterium]|nr:hypothetical protein [Candidatus Latescibacterota bacterium]